MKETTDKIITWVSLGIAVLAAVFAVIFALNTQNEGMFNIAYWITFLFVILSIIGILCFAILSLVKNFQEKPAQARKTLIVAGIAVVVCVISYLLATGSDVSAALLDKNGLTEGTSRWIGAACILVYILVIAAIASIIYVECAKIFKKK